VPGTWNQKEKSPVPAGRLNRIGLDWTPVIRLQLSVRHEDRSPRSTRTGPLGLPSPLRFGMSLFGVDNQSRLNILKPFPTGANTTFLEFNGA
jgi:hypothetical protein